MASKWSRPFISAEATPGAAVGGTRLHDLETNFAADSSSTGRSIPLDGVPISIVGGFTGTFHFRPVVGVGRAGAMGMSRLIAGFLSGVTPLDALVHALCAVGVLAVTTLLP